MRLRHVKNAPEIIEANKRVYSPSPELNKGKWREAFEFKPESINLEIGCGKGKFIKDMALAFPNKAFIGMEMMTSVICRATQTVNEAEVNNVLLVNKDAANLKEYFEDHEVDRIYINFPDPWPKERHAKRRLTSPKFLSLYKDILKKDGVLRFKTDNVDLYNYSVETLLPVLDNPKYGEVEYTEDTIKTEFEQRFLDLGNKIYFIEGTFK